MTEKFKELLETLPHQRYDIVNKDIFGAFPEELLREFTNIPGLQFVEQLETELPIVEMRRMDILAKTRIDAQEVLVHIEFQVNRESASEIVKRKIGYFGRCFERYGLPILSYTIYLGPDAGGNDPGRYSQKFPGHNIEIEYQVIRLSELDGQSIFDTKQTSLVAFTPLMKPPEGISEVQWIEQCREMTLTLPLEQEMQNNLLLWQWILSGLIVDPAEIQHLMEGPMLESSTYRYILQQGIEQGIEQGARENAVKSILNVLDVRFHVGAEQTLKLSLERIEDLHRLEELLRAAAQTESFAAFMRTLITNDK